MNTAREILEALENLKQYKGDVTVADAWARIFATSPESADYYLAMSGLMVKFDRTVLELASAQPDEREKRLFMNALNSLRRFTNPREASQIKVENLVKSQPSLDLLYLAGRLLDDFMVPDIQQVTLNTIASEISQVLDDIEKCDPPIDGQLRAFLVLHLSSLLMAVRSYGVLGADGVGRVFGVVAAEIGRLQSSEKATVAKADGRFQKLVGLVKKVGALIVWANSTTSGAAGILESGGNVVSILEQMTGE